MTISATDILVPVCSKIPLLYLLTQKVAQKFGYVLGIFYLSFDAAHRKHWRCKSRSLALQTDPLIKPILKSIDCVIL